MCSVDWLIFAKKQVEATNIRLAVGAVSETVAMARFGAYKVHFPAISRRSYRCAPQSSHVMRAG